VLIRPDGSVPLVSDISLLSSDTIQYRLLIFEPRRIDQLAMPSANDLQLGFRKSRTSRAAVAAPSIASMCPAAEKITPFSAAACRHVVASNFKDRLQRCV
jgi:hypothetical protein